MDEQDVVTIYGGNGFVGHYLVRILAKTGAKINIITRKEALHNDLALCGYAGQIVHVKFSNSREKLSSIITGSTYVINLIGRLCSNEKELDYANAIIPRKIAEAVKRSSVKRFIHISAIGADSKTKSKYMKSKLKGEKAVLHEFQDSIILRPSLIVGPRDNFVNIFLQTAKLLPIIPIIGSKKFKFQPIYVNDVAQCIYNALIFNDSKAIYGKTLSIAGNNQYSMREIIEIALKCVNRKRLIFRLPSWASYLVTLLSEILMSDKFSMEHLQLLNINSTLSKQQNSVSTLGVVPLPIQYVLNSYLI